MKGAPTILVVIGALSLLLWTAFSLAEQSRASSSTVHVDRLEDLGVYAPGRGAWVLIDTARRRMVVRKGLSSQEYRVALGPSPDEPKREEGDGRTPRGVYTICHRFRADRFHRFLALSYPSTRDARRGSVNGLLSPIGVQSILAAERDGRCPPWDTDLGGNVGIHGWGQNHSITSRHDAFEDWTDGCIGVTNQEIERIYENVPVGTPVVLF